MNFKSKTVKIIMVAALILGAYNFVFSASEEPLLVSSGLMNSGSNNLITLLLEIKSISLTSELFSDKAFLNLQDFSIEIEPQPSGRNNPFSTIGNDPIPVATTTAVDSDILTPLE